MCLYLTRGTFLGHAWLEVELGLVIPKHHRDSYLLRSSTTYLYAQWLGGLGRVTRKGG